MGEGRFQDRRDAGKAVASLVSHLERENPVVLALPRGGVPVAYEIASALRAPLDVLPVRKLGVPGREELAFGAIAGGGRVLNEEVVGYLQLPQGVIDSVVAKEEEELRRRERAYRGERQPVDILGRTVIVVDDGIATGATIRAAVMVLRQRDPARIAIAVPVASPETCAELATVAEEVICARQPQELTAIGLWYEDFTQTPDEDVTALLAAASEWIN